VSSENPGDIDNTRIFFTRILLMPKIFISYRRDDSALVRAAAGTILQDPGELAFATTLLPETGQVAVF